MTDTLPARAAALIDAARDAASRAYAALFGSSTSAPRCS